MPAAGQEDDVPCFEDPAAHEIPSVVVKVDADAPPLQDEDFIREEDFPADAVVNVGIDDLACGMPHVRKLLRERVGREEVYSRLAKTGSHQDGCEVPIDVDLLHGVHGVLIDTRPHLSRYQ